MTTANTELPMSFDKETAQETGMFVGANNPRWQKCGVILFVIQQKLDFCMNPLSLHCMLPNAQLNLRSALSQYSLKLGRYFTCLTYLLSFNGAIENA